VIAFSAGARYRKAMPIAILLSVTVGCTSIEVAIGLKTRLDDVPVTGLAATLIPGPALAPGESARLVLTASTADGKKLVTEGPGHGTVVYESFVFTATVAQVDKQGVVSLSADPRLSDGKTPKVHIGVIGHPDVVADIEVPVHYNVAYTADYSGRAGSSGFNGLDGSTGMSGSTGSMDPDHPSPGGNGSAGGDGGNGQDGGAGEDGKAVQVWMTRKPEPYLLLQVRVVSEGHEQYFLLDPAGGTLAVRADGGRGGSGGRGGHGGAGGAGGIGTPNGMSGSSGQDGRNGNDGPPGAAGSIVVSVDPQAQPFLDRLRLSNTNGNGAPGPAPQIRVVPVAPLW
jgi:hypothetical protein